VRATPSLSSCQACNQNPSFIEPCRFANISCVAESPPGVQFLPEPSRYTACAYRSRIRVNAGRIEVFGEKAALLKAGSNWIARGPYPHKKIRKSPQFLFGSARARR
jgi:hypothetical protein